MAFLWRFVPLNAFRSVVEDVLEAVKHVHVSGILHDRVLADIGRYVWCAMRCAMW